MGVGRHELSVEHDAAARGAVVLHVGPKIEHALAHEHEALDHPIERAAIEHLGNVTMPVVVRLEGTNVEEGRRILREAPFPFLVAEQMADAAQKIVAAANAATAKGKG